MYNLFIRRYGRNLYFDTLEELTEEVKQYFTPKEIARGIVEKLCTFHKHNEKDGMIKNSYQDFETIMYID